MWSYEYFLNHHKLIAIGLSKRFELENPDLRQWINFIGTLEKDNNAAMFSIIEKIEETVFSFSQNFVSII